jgi:Ca2+/Na+ antiporter
MNIYIYIYIYIYIFFFRLGVRYEDIAIMLCLGITTVNLVVCVGTAIFSYIKHEQKTFKIFFYFLYEETIFNPLKLTPHFPLYFQTLKKVIFG